MSLENRWGNQIDALSSQGLLRQLTPPRGIDFSSNDYLGFSKNPSINGHDGERSGTSSRLVRGHHQVWEKVESRLAQWYGKDCAALMMTSGYAANEGLLSTVIEPHDWVASDELNHASIIDGIRLSNAEKFIFRHNDLEHLEKGLRQAAATRSKERELFIVTESLFGMEGDCAPLDQIVGLAKKFDAHVIVDEAHATGCLGPEGKGRTFSLDDANVLLATVHTGGKALAVPGAYIIGSRLLKEFLINRCRHFIYTTALPPTVGAWWIDSINRVTGAHREREKLLSNAFFFRQALASNGIPTYGEHYVVPIILGDNDRALSAAQTLQKEGFDVRAIRPPTVPPGTARLRISIHADHDQAGWQALADAVARTISGIKP